MPMHRPARAVAKRAPQHIGRAEVLQRHGLGHLAGQKVDLLKIRAALQRQGFAGQTLTQKALEIMRALHK